MARIERIRERFAVEFYLWTVPSKPWTKAEEYAKGICLSTADELIEYLRSEGIEIDAQEMP